MTLFYQSGRVSRLSVGVPGFTTSGDLTLDVSGSLGIGTTQPRSEADVPNISIRGDIRDSANETGANAYYLSQDAVGVRWRAGNPDALQVINVQDDGVQVGFGSFDTLNFIGSDPFVVTINEGNPNTLVADILINPGFVKSQYGATNNSFSLSTSFGPDGTFWSIPGYQPGFGVSESPGFTAVGLGTNKPTDDFQVGVGSTGVTINAALGRVRAQIIEADSIEVDGNLTVESLVVTPGIATLTDLEVINTAGIPTAYIGLASITEAQIGFATITNLVAGASSLGVNGEDTFVFGDLFVNGGIGSFAGDVFIKGDLEVGGEFTVGQLNAINALISGIATINNIDGNVGVFTAIDVGVGTIGQLGFTTAIGVGLSLGNLDVGVATALSLDVGIATIGFASITDANVSGALTVTKVDVENIEIDTATVGILTVGTGLSVTGVSTFVGLVTVTGEVFVDGDLTVTEQFTVKDLGAENLEVTGIGTIVELQSNVGIITQLFTEGIGNSGIITTRGLEADTIEAGVGTIASIFATDIDADFGRIGILTGNILDYNVGLISSIVAGLATVGIITGDQLFYYGNSEINGAIFLDDVFRVNRNVEINSGVTTFNTGAPGVGFATFSDDLYVGNDLYVAGELSFNQLTGENLLVTGIGTINELVFDTGIGTFLNLEYLQVGLATITDLRGSVADINDISSDNLTVRNVADTRFLGARFITVNEDPSDPGSGIIDTPRLTVRNSANVANITETGTSNVANQIVARELVGISTIQWLTVTGIATIADINFQTAAGGVLGVGTINAGFGSFGAISIGNTLSGDGTIIDEDGITADNGTFRDTLNANTGIITNLQAENADVGLATITNSLLGVSTITFGDIENLNAGVSTIGILTVTESIFVNGVSTFSGITSFFGSVIVDGDLTVTGVTTFNQLDADQSQIGILTTKTLLDSNGLLDAENVSISTTLTVNGTSEFVGFATFDEAKFEEITVGILSVTEQAYFENIYQSPTGIATLNIVAISSASIDEANINDATIGVATVGFGSFDNLFAANANLSGVITATGEIDVTGEVNISGIATIDQLDVTGIATIANEIVGFSSIGVATITEADVEDLDVEYLRVGTYATFGSDPSAGILSVTGVSTFTGFTTFSGDVFIDGDLTVTGIASYNQLDADQSQIGILTVSNYLNVQDIIQNPTGFSTLSNISFNIGVGTSVKSEYANIGVQTSNLLDVNFIDAGITTTIVLDSALSSIGVATASRVESGSIGVTGITSTSTLIVSNAAAIRDLTVSNNTILNGDTVTADITVGAGSSITSPSAYVDLVEVRHLEADTIKVGIETVTNRLDIADGTTALPVQDTTTVRSVKREIGPGTTDILISIDPALYSSFDATIQSVDSFASNIQCVRIHGLSDGIVAYSNQYSTIFNNTEFTTFNVIQSGFNYIIQATNSSPNTTVHTMNITLTRVP